jgi:hypothetical protein
MNKLDFYIAVPFNKLVIKKGYKSIKQIPYEELLNTREWFVKRIHILNRDNFFCKSCGAGEGEYEQENLYFIPYEQYPCDSDMFAIKLEEGYKIFEYAIAGNSRYQIYLHVHHKYYIADRLPWDYPDEALITMCSKCHYEFHQNNVVDIFDKNGRRMILTPCHRCNGAGIFPEFTHVIGGLCFRCKGAKFEEYILE